MRKIKSFDNFKVIENKVGCTMCGETGTYIASDEEGRCPGCKGKGFVGSNRSKKNHKK